MSGIVTRYKNKKFVKERVELDSHAYDNCTFVECLIVLEKGETEIKNCVFQKSRLMLLGQALQIARVLKDFIGEKPLKVLDFAEPGIFGEQRKFTADFAESAEKEK
ncbi:MAG: hypothetical protein FJ117_20900 [Deltaproteobacteria bacterium]|nr:hypothetical protein [Deltaproteobacteria bacterium]